MSIVTYDTASAVRAQTTPKAAPASKRPSLFARFYAALMEARRRQAFEELKRHGVMLPNELELAGWKVNERSEDQLPFTR